MTNAQLLPGFVANSKVSVAEKTWDDFERDFAQRYAMCTVREENVGPNGLTTLPIANSF